MSYSDSWDDCQNQAVIDGRPPPEPTNWVVSDMTRSDFENPAFGPMTEREAKQFATRSDRYWAHQLPVTRRDS